MEHVIQDLLSNLSINEILIRLAFGSLIGLCLGLTGVGGGVLIIPVLQVFFGLTPVVAVGTASIVAVIVKVNAALNHILAKNVSWKEVCYITIGAAPATLLVSDLIVRLTKIPEYQEQLNTLVQYLILAIMMFSLLTMIKKYQSSKSNQRTFKNSTSSRFKGIGSGAACGAIMASTGVGGGVLILPTLNTVLGLDIKKSVGSSILVALFLSAISAVKYSSGGQSDISTAIILAVGSFVGVPIAVRIVKHLDSLKMYLITIFIILVSLMLTIPNVVNS